jgi:hypothetical protein
VVVLDEEKILTKHPEGKKGVRISKNKYNLIRSTIVECLRDEPLTHLELTKCVNQKLSGKFQGSISWYAETVKLDLEAMGTIERVKEMKPHVYKLA